MDHRNLFEDIPENLSSEVFEVLAQSETVRIERILSKGHTSPDTGWYDQDQHEWVIVLKGSARLMFEDGSTTQLEEGDYLNVPAHQKHRVISTSATRVTVWLAIHY